MKKLKYGLFILFLFAYNFIYGQKDNKIYTIVEQQPEYPEGQAALFRYLMKNLKYPKDAVGFCSTMILAFIIEKNGRAKFKSCQFRSCDLPCNEMKKVITKMPKWKAGMQNGKAVRVLYTLPVRIEWE